MNNYKYLVTFLVSEKKPLSLYSPDALTAANLFSNPLFGPSGLASVSNSSDTKSLHEPAFDTAPDMPVTDVFYFRDKEGTYTIQLKKNASPPI